MMYETASGSGEYMVSNDSTWPQDGYVFIIRNIIMEKIIGYIWVIMNGQFPVVQIVRFIWVLLSR